MASRTEMTNTPQTKLMAQHNITQPSWLYPMNVVEIRLAQLTTEAAANLDKNK